MAQKRGRRVALRWGRVRGLVVMRVTMAFKMGLTRKIVAMIVIGESRIVMLVTSVVDHPILDEH